MAGGAKSRNYRDVDGILVFDKPPGVSSNRALQRVRAMFQARKRIVLMGDWAFSQDHQGRETERRLMDRFLSHGVKTGSSDLHFRVGDRPAYRIDGALRPVKHAPLTPADTVAICNTLLGDLAAKTDFEELHEHDCSYSIPGVARFRVNIYRQRTCPLATPEASGRSSTKTRSTRSTTSPWSRGT